MSLTPEMLDAMVAAGASAEVIAAAVKAQIAADERKKVEQRAKAAERQRKRRERNAASRDVTVTERDNALQRVTARDPSPPSPSPSSSPPTPPLITTPSTSPTPLPSLRSGGADAPRDIRGDLFGNGLAALARITGKTPDSCRALVGRWLKSVNDEAIHVLGAIEDAERNRVADPVAWINRALQPRTGNGHGKRTVHEAADDLIERVRAFDAPASVVDGTLRGPAGKVAVRRLPSG